MDRKAAKKQGRQIVKKHYRLLVAACLIAAFLGAEFSGSLNAFQGSRSPTLQVAAGAISSGGEVEIASSEIVSSEGAEQVYVLRRLASVPSSTEDLYALAEILYLNYFPDVGGRPESEVFGRTRGVLAGLVNALSPSTFFTTVLTAAHSATNSENAAIILSIAVAAVLLFLFWMLVKQNCLVALRRVTLESLEYDKTSIRRLTYLLSDRRWWRTALAMFRRSLYLFLWNLTIVGGVIKRYSYFLVPYLVAENPRLTGRQAITLSRRMMKGHKWECFVWELTFVGWSLLGLVTLGLTNLFYANAYKTASFALYYAQVRRQAIRTGVADVAVLNDHYLYEHPTQEQLDNAYGEIAQLRDQDMSDPITQDTGLRHFLAKNFGISLYSKTDEAKYDEKIAARQQLWAYEDILLGRAYPPRLHPSAHTKASKMPAYNYLRHYSIPSLILLFFILAFVGWAWEIAFHLVNYGELVNRGILHGPWLPIYGAGSVMILVLLNRFRGRFFLEFTLAMALAGTMEYATSWFLEVTHNGQRWWDYSGYYLNLNGRICAEGLLLFGIGGVAVVYVLAPWLDSRLRKLKHRWAIPLCVALVALFTLDNIYSHFHPNAGPGVTTQTEAAVTVSSPRPLL